MARPGEGKDHPDDHFFFSSRRRHTRCGRDWSSDVCSSDLFGSARTPRDHHYYKMAEEIAARLVRHGYGVITGGGPGIMEAGNKGAHSENGKSVGLNIHLPRSEERRVGKECRSRW